MKTKKTRGFTIVELLTVMAVIAVLIGLLIPALGLVKDHAKEIQQKAQFHGIDVGLEMFKSEFGDYPDSFDNNFGLNPLDSEDYCGAQKLAEALVGWDLLGFHPKSGFRPSGLNYFPPSGAFGGGDQLVYNTQNGAAGGLKIGSYNEVDGAANIKARKDEMIELEHANAFKIRDIYDARTGGFNPNNFVLCDAYAKKRLSAVKTGMPILYFKARTNYQFQDYRTTNNADNTTDDIYNYEDNLSLVALGMAEAGNPPHELLITPADTLLKFENMILNTQVQQAANVNRPYKADSYILISAGKDGSYGTADDLFNFDKGVSE